jgi:3-dehydrosphinganine reductase
MFSPGYEEENKTKPELVLKIEESDGGLTPEKAAEGLYEGTVPASFFFFFGRGAESIIHAGVKKGDFHITDTFIANLFRTSTRGASPFGSNILKDLLFGVIGTVRFCASS